VTAMPGASEQTSQVKVLNVNWAPTGLTRIAVTTPGQ